MVFRNIRIKMANGKFRIQKAKVLASGKLKFVKNKARTVHRHVKRGASHVKRRVTKRKSTTRRAPVRSNNRKRSNNKGVVGGFLKKIPLINNPTVRKIFIAAGAVSIIVSVLSIISPRAAGAANSTVGRGVIGLATGDVVGAAANVLLPLLQGRGGGLSLGGGGNSSNEGGNAAVQGTAGFA